MSISRPSSRGSSSRVPSSKNNSSEKKSSLPVRVIRWTAVQVISFVLAVLILGIWYAAVTWTNIPSGSGAAGQPVTQTLIQGIINNINYLSGAVGILDTKITNLSWTLTSVTQNIWLTAVDVWKIRHTQGIISCKPAWSVYTIQARYDANGNPQINCWTAWVNGNTCTKSFAPFSSNSLKWSISLNGMSATFNYDRCNWLEWDGGCSGTVISETASCTAVFPSPTYSPPTTLYYAS